MQNYTRSPAHLTSGVSTFDELAPPLPNYVEVQAQPATVETNLGFVLTVANLAVTAILITGMLVNGSQVQSAFLIGGAYFATTTTAFVFVITGALTAMVNGWQREKTERLRVSAYRELGTMSLQWRIAVERSRQLEMQPAPPSLPVHRPDVEGVQRVSPLNTFVEPYVDADRAAIEAVRWAEQLYDRTALGAPDPRKVQLSGESLGRLRVRMIGSKRGGGSRDAGVWLLRQGVIQKVAGGYALRLEAFPYRHYLHALL